MGSTSEPITAVTATPTPPVPGTNVSGSVVAVQNAREALAQQLGVNVEDITVVSSGQVDWPNGCLGVAKPGMMCTDAIVPGYQVILEVNGKQYEVRTDLSGQQVVVVPEGGTALAASARSRGACSGTYRRRPRRRARPRADRLRRAGRVARRVPGRAGSRSSYVPRW